MKENLFLFTKTFPFGNGEQYLEEELPVLSTLFRKIYLVPCSIFNASPATAKKFPANAEVFLVNKAVKRKTLMERFRSARQLAAVTADARRHNLDGEFLERNLAQYQAIFRQQQACATAVEQFMKEKKADANNSVFYSYWTHNSCIILGILKNRGVINHFVTRAHSYDLYHRNFYPEKEDKSPLGWERFKFSEADTVYCISDHGAEYLKKRYPQWAGKFKVSRLGVETPSAENPPAKNEKAFRIVTCSTVQPLKRLTALPEILSLVEFPVEWVHFGTGDPQYVEELNAAWEKYKKPQHTFNYKGYTPNQEVKNYYVTEHIDLFLNLSIAEGVPVSLMEAAGYGIPLLATDVYGNAEVARPECGFLLPKFFEPVLAAEVFMTLKNNPELCERLRKGAKKVQQEYFDAKKNFNAFGAALLAEA